MTPRKTVIKRISSDGEDYNPEAYRLKRERNNLAVKRSRVKTKQRTTETQNRITRLRKENEALEDRAKMLANELQLLKDLFLAAAANSDSRLKDIDLDKLLADEDSIDSVS